MDPFLGNPDNFCGATGAGCTAAHAPGFLATGNAVTQSASTIPGQALSRHTRFRHVLTASRRNERLSLRFHQHYQLHHSRPGPGHRPARHLRGNSRRRVYTRGVGRHVARLHPGRPRARRSAASKTVDTPRSMILRQSPSRPRWRCSAPPCSASACSAAAARLVSLVIFVNEAAPSGAVSLCAVGPRGFCGSARRLARRAAIVKNSDRPWPAQMRSATRRS